MPRVAGSMDSRDMEIMKHKHDAKTLTAKGAKFRVRFGGKLDWEENRWGLFIMW